jgi:hypothetical protein
MNTRLIAAMAARRAKARNLPLKHVRINPGPGFFDEVMVHAYKNIKRVDRLIAWIAVLGLVGFLTWRLLDIWWAL